MASARVGSPITSCQRLTGTWLVIKQRAAIVAAVDDLEQIAALLGVERLRSPIVDDQQSDAFERGQQTRQAALAARLAQVAEQAAGALVEHRETVATGLVTEGTGEPRLADAGRPR